VTDGPDTARTAMVAALRDHVRRPSVVDALAAVPRHPFLAEVGVAKAYAPHRAVVIKRDAAGNPLSSASAPGIVALMLDQLDVRPGQRILEIGAGTGWNADGRRPPGAVVEKVHRRLVATYP
jgi:protein-L-isoaspartate(D-aspartate) O-methyltransferase